MKRFLLALFLVLALSGCAVYTGASTVALITTDKSITDHAVTLAVPNSTCSSLQPLRGQYYCEIRDISQTYNRNRF
jgi:hypothetical protein